MQHTVLTLYIYTEQKWKGYTTIFYILWESIGQKLFNKAK